MCWNAEVSLNTFAISAFATCLSLANGVISPWLAAIFASFFTMQLIEAIAWMQIGKGKSTYWASIFAVGLLILQPILTLAAGLYETKNGMYPSWVVYSLYIISAIYASVLMCFGMKKLFTSSISNFSMTPAANGHLKWGFLSVPYSKMSIALIVIYMIALLIPVALATPFWFSTIVITTLVISLVTFFLQGTWGTMWCWTANLTALVLFFLIGKMSVCQI